MNSLTVRLSIPAMVIMGIIFGAMSLSPVYALEIRVRDQATVHGSTIYLRDIASFHPESDPRVDMLAGIDVASAPSPGNGVSFNRSFLNYKIGSAISGKDDITLELPASMVVKRTAHLISAVELEKIFRDHVKSRVPWDLNKIVFEKIEVPETVALPEGKVHWEIWDKGSDRYLGHVAATINFFVDGKQVRNVPVSGKITLRQAVVKAARKINPGQVLSKEDVTLVAEQSGQLNKDLLTNLDDAVGKKSVRSIQPGQPVTSQMIEDPPVVKKGNRVVIQAQSDVIKVSAQGKVMEDGRMGEQVRVVNIGSGKEVFATVKGPGLVEVTF
jgi:flagella basal body P-ring formation protein FlgA